MIEQINYYKKDITFKENNLVFFNSKNIIINKLFKKSNDKMFDSFKIIFIINSFYKLKLSEIIKTYNVFYLKLLNFVVINLLFNQRKNLFKVITVKNKEK